MSPAGRRRRDCSILGHLLDADRRCHRCRLMFDELPRWRRALDWLTLGPVWFKARRALWVRSHPGRDWL